MPGTFSISFFSDSIRYDYELSLNKQEVIFEKLFYSSKIVERIPFSEFLRYPHAKFKQIQEICK